MARMAEQVDDLPLTQLEDFATMVDILDKMDAIVHRHRGEAIAAGQGNGARSAISLEESKAWRDRKGPGSDTDPKPL